MMYHKYITNINETMTYQIVGTTMFYILIIIFTKVPILYTNCFVDLIRVSYLYIFTNELFVFQLAD